MSTGNVTFYEEATTRQPQPSSVYRLLVIRRETNTFSANSAKACHVLARHTRIILANVNSRLLYTFLFPHKFFRLLASTAAFRPCHYCPTFSHFWSLGFATAGITTRASHLLLPSAYCPLLFRDIRPMCAVVSSLILI